MYYGHWIAERQRHLLAGERMLWAVMRTVIPNIFGGFAIALTLASSIIALISIVIGFARYVWEKL